MDKINVDIRTYLCRHTDILEYINADTRTNVNGNLQTHVNAYIRTYKTRTDIIFMAEIILSRRTTTTTTTTTTSLSRNFRVAQRFKNLLSQLRCDAG